MKVYEVLKKVSNKAVCEYLITEFGFTKDEVVRFDKGLNNLRNVKPLESTDKISLYFDGISSRDQTLLNRHTIMLNDWDAILGCDIDYEVTDNEYFISVLIQDLFFGTINPENVEFERMRLHEDLKASEAQSKNGQYFSLEEVMAHIKSQLPQAPKTPEVGEIYKSLSGTKYRVELVGESLDTYHNIIALKELEPRCDIPRILMLDECEMLKDLGDIEFSTGPRKYRFELVEE